MQQKINYKEIAKYSLRTALFVGIILTMINHYRSIMDWSFTLIEASTWLLNFIVPFVVSFYSRAMSEKNSVRKKHAMTQRNETLEEELKNTTKSLEEHVEQTKISQEEESKRSWKAESIAYIAGILREKENDAEIFDHFISALVNTLKVNQGGIFLVKDDEEQKYLYLTAMYAYSRKKFIQKKIGIGEGLVGQCYLEKKSIHITEVPEDYISIQSGLGETAPDTLFIFPVMQNGHIEGIIELASLNPLQPHEIDFLNESAVVIASFIANHRINEQTKHLLVESRQTAEQLKEKEEQMLQSFEELETTQEEMRRNEADREKLLKKLRIGIIEQNLKEIKVNIALGLKAARHEINFLGQVPPIHGLIRASENNGYDQEGNSTFEEWLSRFLNIIENLMLSKQLYSEVALVENTGQTVCSSTLEGQKFMRSETKNSFMQHLDEAIKIKPDEVYIGEASIKTNRNFEFIFAKPICHQKKTRFILFISANSDQILDLISSKEDAKNKYAISDSGNNILYKDVNDTFVSGVNETISIYKDYQFLITHYMQE